VDTRNSQKKSPRSSARSKRDTSGAPEAAQPHRKPIDELDEEDKYMDRSIDQVARVRAAKEAAQREMESFGDVSEYDVTVIQGQLKEEPVAASQSALEFHDDPNTGQQEEG
jgi:hypothetical protein